MIRLSLFSRPGCHLCEEMKTVVRRVAAATTIELDEVDISGDPALEVLYGAEIPVLVLGATKVAKFRISESELRRVLEKRRE